MLCVIRRWQATTVKIIDYIQLYWNTYANC